jgi:glycosyltransferase involved in cell wall biosynthesis
MTLQFTEMDQKKHILILTPEIPYPVFKGNQSRIDQTIKVLLAEGNDVSIAVLNFNQESRTSTSVQQELKEHYPNISEVEVRRHPRFNKGAKPNLLQRLVTRPEKNQVSNKDSCPDNYKKLVHEMVAQLCPTHILVNYVKLDRAIPKNYNGVKIVDTHDIQTNIISAAIKSGTFKKKIDIQSFESEEYKLLSTYDFIVSINPNETREIQKKLPKQKILTLPAFNDTQTAHISGKEIYDILFVGSASPFNSEGIKHFIRHSFPAVRKALPNVKLAIAGEVSNIASVKALKNPNIVYLGRVDDLTKTYAQSKVVVSPIMSGAGMKVKNIEAFSHGMPIVATTFSMDGIEGKDGINCFIKDDNAQFSKSVIDLLKDEELRKKISHNAYMLAKTYYSRTTAARSYYSIINNDFTYRPEIISNGTAKHVAAAVGASTKRTKALIYSSDADYLISYKLALADSLKQLGVYSEFVTMDAARCNRFLSQGYLAHPTRPDLEKKKRESIKAEIRENLKSKGRLEVTLKGVNISDDIKTYQEMFPEHFEGKKLVDVIAHAILILDSILRRISKTNPDFLVGWNGNGPHFIFLMKVAAKISGIPVFHVERGLLPDTLVFDSQGVNFKSYISGSYLPLITEAERESARNYIVDFSSKGKTIVGKTEESALSRQDVNKTLGLSSDAEYLFFPMQIEGDSNIVLNSPVYKKMASVIEDLEYVAQQTGLKIICRPHPEYSLTPEELKSLHPGVIFDNSLHLHTMLKHSAANVVINSTVGLESILLGKPTIALGHSVYSAKGITLDAFHRDHIAEAINKIVNAELDTVGIALRTEALVHQLFSNSLVRLDDLNANKPILTNVLLKNGIVINDSLPEPKPPQLATRYMQQHKSFLSAIKGAQRILVCNTLAPDARLWLNGNTRPIFTDEMILKHFSKLTEAEITITNEGNQATTEKDTLKVVITPSKSTKKLKSTSTNEFHIDEYFYPVA